MNQPLGITGKVSSEHTWIALASLSC